MQPFIFKTVYLLFLKNIVCPYKEIEGVSKLDEYFPKNDIVGSE